MAEFDDNRIKDVSHFIDTSYMEKLSKSGASQIRLLLLYCHLVNIAKVCMPNYQITAEMSRLRKEVRGKIKEGRIKNLAKRFEKLGEDSRIKPWDLEATYMHSDEFWNRNNELEDALLELYKISVDERGTKEYDGPGWESWLDYFEYLGLTSEKESIQEIAISAVKKGKYGTSS